MYLTENHFINKNDERYKIIDELCFLSKNLYNATLYDIRQYYFENKKFKHYNQVINDFRKNDNIDFRRLPSKIAAEVCKQVGLNFISFFNNKTNKNKRIPKYLDKKGRNALRFNKQTISKNFDKNKDIYTYTLCKKDLNLKIKSKIQNIQYIEIHQKYDSYNIKIVYKVEENKIKKNDNIAAIDLGINNIAAIAFNNGQSILINGKPIKSINQYYNKKVAKMKSLLPKNIYTSKNIKKLTKKRNNKIDYELHKISKEIVNQLVSKNTSLLIIGYNQGWKQDINIGKVNNQKFVNIPYLKLINYITYKSKLKGIEVIINEESYTSKCSFLDKEEIKKKDEYVGKRIKRGLFRTKNNLLINADINGAFNIMRKVVSNDMIYSNEIEGFVISPLCFSF